MQHINDSRRGRGTLKLRGNGGEEKPSYYQGSKGEASATESCVPLYPREFPDDCETRMSSSQSLTTRRLFLEEIQLPPPSRACPEDDISQNPDDTGTEQDEEMLRQRRLAFRAKIEELFSSLGTVEEVFVPDRTLKRYAFVRMSTTEEAQSVLAHYSNNSTTGHKDDATGGSHRISPWFESVRPALTIAPRNQLSTKKQSQHQLVLDEILPISKASNLIIQLHKSHLERLQDYLGPRGDFRSLNPSLWDKCSALNVLGVSTDKSVGFIYCHVEANKRCYPPSEPSADAEWIALTAVAEALEETMYIQPILHRVLLLPKASREEPMRVSYRFVLDDPERTVDEHGSENAPNNPSLTMAALDLLLETSQTKHSSLQQCNQIRLATYPTKLVEYVLEKLQARIDTAPPDNAHFEFSPQMATSQRVLTVTQLVAPPKPSKAGKSIGKGFYVLTIAPAHNASPERNIGNSEEKTEICRAYWKLQEAFQRYKGIICAEKTSQSVKTNLPFVFHNAQVPKHELAGIDVGASPGGWTQFLIEECGCQTVYSIDPGDLDDGILQRTKAVTSSSDDIPVDTDEHHATKRRAQPIVQHFVSTFQKALPEISRQRKRSPVHFYVSDMCVKDVSAQIDALEQAADLGIVQGPSSFTYYSPMEQMQPLRGTFVVLTLKCTRGHSKATFDQLVEAQTKRITNRLDDMKIIHLFFNRKSERTVLGFWK